MTNPETPAPDNGPVPFALRPWALVLDDKYRAEGPRVPGPKDQGLVVQDKCSVQYACRDPETCSLYPVPPDQSRRELYCRYCTAKNCCFGGTADERRGELTNELIPLPRFAERMGIGQATAHDYRRAGMPAVQEGRHWHVPELAARRWVRENASDRTYRRLFIHCDSPPTREAEGLVSPQQGLPQARGIT